MWVDTEDLSPNMACKPVRGRGLILFVILLALMPTQTASAKIVPTTRVVLDDLDWPVQLTFTPDGRVLFIEKDTGQIRIVEADVLRPEPLLDVRLHIAPANETLAPEGLSGLLGLAIDPGFKNDPWIYVYYTYRNQQNLSWNRLERFLINGVTIVRAEVLLDGIPDGFDHNGGVLQFGPDGMLYITTGDAFQPSLAQNLASLAGKVLRIAPNGSIPPDNPFAQSPIFTVGHRNLYGLAFHPISRAPYVSENGPAEPDELNRLVAGGNYGWPTVVGIANDPRFVDPVVELPDRMAPTGIAFFTGEFPAEWRGDLFMGNVRYGQLLRLGFGEIETQVESQEVVFDGDEPVIDVDISPDGLVYFTTSSKIIRVEPVIGPDEFLAVLFVIATVAAGITPVAIVVWWVRRREGRNRLRSGPR